MQYMHTKNPALQGQLTERVYMELLAYSHQVQVVDIKKKNMHDKAENQGRFSTRFKGVVVSSVFTSCQFKHSCDFKPFKYKTV